MDLDSDRKDAKRLVRAFEAGDPEELRRPLEAIPRETVIDTGLAYRPGDPVRVRVLSRGRRISVTDGGAAADRAGLRSGWRVAAERVARELDVNVSRHGVISLPVVRVGPCEEKIVRRIGEASLGLYQELLELEEHEQALPA